MKLPRFARVLLVVLFLGAARALPADEKTDNYALMKLFVDTFEQIDRNYVKEVDRRELIEAAVRGMLQELDPYSNYVDPQDLERFNQQVDQEFGGIGIQVHVNPKTRELTVMTPLPGTPAYEQGVRAGDVIVEIEGLPTSDFKEDQELETAVKLLKGKPGEAVTIGLRHAGSTGVEKVTIVRDTIHVATVLGDAYKTDGSWNFMLDDDKKIGYVRLTHFSRKSAEELKEALEQLTKEGMKALILDMRLNPGGLLSAATEISDLFIEDGVIVSTKGRNTEDREWTAHKPGTFSGFPMVVLVNRYSASASEIVSACLQDHGRAVIVGERSFGKGSVQNVIALEEGKSALKLTTQSYHRPSGKNIHRFPKATEADEWGVMPDPGFLVEFDQKQFLDYVEHRQKRDILTGVSPKKNDYEDSQLKSAIDYIVEKLTPPADAKTEPDSPGSDSKPVEKAAAPDAAAPEETRETKPSDSRASIIEVPDVRTS